MRQEQKAEYLVNYQIREALKLVLDLREGFADFPFFPFIKSTGMI